MDLLAVVEHHGYAVTAVVLFLACCGLPLPLSVVLLAAGAAAHGGSLNLGLVIVIACAAALCGDMVMYLGGRFTGWWLLAGLCRVSMNPETCIFASANSFYKRGPNTLLVAKFIPGLSTVAAPLAGSLNMRLPRFLLLDAAGVLLYVSAWTVTGFVFARFLRELIGWGACAWAMRRRQYCWRCWCFMRSGWRQTGCAIRASVPWNACMCRSCWSECAYATHEKLMVIADVRSHGYYDPGMQRIKNSIRVEPSRLKEELVALREFMQPECEIYLYCSCAREATSVRVAKMLEQENCSTKVIQGGLKAWLKAGGPTEPVPAGDVEHLPKFD